MFNGAACKPCAAASGRARNDAGFAPRSAGMPSASREGMWTRAHHRIALALVAGAVLTAWSGTTRAADAEIDASASSLRKEFIGFELTPVSVSLPGSPPSYRPGHVDRYQAGFGAGVRLLRFRWEYAYVIPIQAGVYVSSGNGTIFAHIGAEGGVVVPGTDRRLELGMGAGAGILAMHYSSDCDGSCTLGGSGFLVSFAARFLFVDGPKLTVGASARLIVPLAQPEGEGFGYYVGDGKMILGGLEIAFGRR